MEADGGAPQAADEDEVDAEQRVATRGGQKQRVLVRGVFILEAHSLQGDEAGSDGVSVEGEQGGASEAKVPFVACDFGRSNSSQFTGKLPEDEGDLESVIRARFALDDEGCLVFADKDGAAMRTTRADPVLLDSQVVAPKSLQGLLVICRMGKCAAAAKAMRAYQAGAKCLVISMPSGDEVAGRQAAQDAPQVLGWRGAYKRLAPPAAGADLRGDIDLPVFCVAREDEEALLMAASVRACLLPYVCDKDEDLEGDNGVEAVQGKSGDGEGGGAGEGGTRIKKSASAGETNILEGVPRTRPKGSGELLSKWERWRTKVDRK